MSIRFDSSFDRLQRTSSIIDHNSAYTVCFWWYQVSDLNDFTHFWDARITTGTDWHEADWLGTNIDGTTLRLGAAVGGSAGAGNGTNMTINTWYHMAVRRTSTSNIEAYLNGVLDITVTKDISSRAATEMVEISSLNSFPDDGRFFAYKEWQASLSAAEIKNEMETIRPQRLANLNHWSPLIGVNVTDAITARVGSGWTSAGTLTIEANPPVGWGNAVYINTEAAAAGGAPTGPPPLNTLLLMGLGR